MKERRRRKIGNTRGEEENIWAVRNYAQTQLRFDAFWGIYRVQVLCASERRRAGHEFGQEVFEISSGHLKHLPCCLRKLYCNLQVMCTRFVTLVSTVHLL